MRSIVRIALALASLYVIGCVLLVLARDRLVFPIRGGETGDPRDLGIRDGERVTIATSDGERLAGWWLPPRGTARTRAGAVLWFHGNGETVEGIGSVLREFRPDSAGLLAIDYRGYGESTGRATVAGTERDAEAAWAWLTARPDVDSSRIVLYGRSVGAGPAAWLAARRPAAGLVLESAFTSLRDMARVHYAVFPSVLAGSGFDNLAALDHMSRPVLIIHGEADQIVPVRMGRALAARAGSHARLWTIPGADHNDSYDVGGDEYRCRFRAFVAEVTAAPR
jgi:hypothetical protein